MLLMSFGLIKSPRPLAQGSLLSERTVPENIQFLISRRLLGNFWLNT